MATIATDTFNRSESDGWGTATLGGAWTIGGGTASDFSCTGSYAKIDMTTVNSSRYIALQSFGVEEAEVLFRFQIEDIPSGGSVLVCPLFRYVDSSNMLGTRITLQTASTIDIIGYQRVSSVNGTFGTTADDVINPYYADTWYWVRTRCFGMEPTIVQCKIWEDGQSEPSSWQFEGQNSVSVLQQIGSLGFRTILSTGNTNNPYIWFEDYGATGEVAGGPPALAPYSFPITVSENTLQLRYDCNQSDLDSGTMDRAIIVIHGMSRNAPDYLDYIQNPADVVGSDALIVAPQFLIAEDLVAFGITAEDDLYWSSNWKQGNTSLTSPYSRVFQISSFTATDELIDVIATNFTNLETIVLIGNSAGGQFVQRYALSTGIVDDYPGIDFQFIITNPGSYCYLDPERRVGDSTTTFDVLTGPQQAACPGWDDYRYGLAANLNSYLTAVGVTAMRAQYEDRNVLYYLGSQDIDEEDPSLDISCPAMWQGDERYERGTAFFNYVAYYYSSAPATHEKLVVPVAHSATGMFNRSEIVPYLFGEIYTWSPVPGGKHAI